MQLDHWLVLVASLAGIALVQWWFFGAEGSGGAVQAGGSVKIVVKGGYSPAVVRVKAGAPVTLVFDRQETSGCSEEVVFPDFGIRRFLPPNQETTVEITPPKPGRYEFMCGMSMLRGAVVAEA